MDVAKLMMGIANVNITQIQPAENMLLSMLSNWSNGSLTVNSFPVPARPGIGTLGVPGSGFLANWPVDTSVGNTCTGLNGQPTSPCPSLLQAPVRLNAIVNRIDLGQNGSPFPPAGELRFVFGVSATVDGSCSTAATAPQFNIILEYSVPSGITALQWAQQWNNLPTSDFGEDYLSALQAITNQVVRADSCGQNPSVSCLAQIRTNEVELATSGRDADLWELRQFQLVQQNGPVLQEAPVFMTPDTSFNSTGHPNCGTIDQDTCTSGTLVSYVNNPNNNLEIQQFQGALPIVPSNWPPNGPPFLGGSAFNGPGAPANAFWNDVAPSGARIFPEIARIDFSSNTCNGCHGAETATDFQQVKNRPVNNSGTPSASLSNFLLGCTGGGDSCTPLPGGGQCPLNSPCQETVTDPNSNAQGQPATSFGDIARRVQYLQTVCVNNTCDPPPGGGALLVPFMRQPIGVH